MKIKRKWLAAGLSMMMAATAFLTGCGSGSGQADTTSETAVQNTTAVTEAVTEETKIPEDGNYIELALNVYYNDADRNYFQNESGPSIIVTKEGQYTVSFDCDADLSAEATGAGVSSLTNLTAIYLKDSGVAVDNQSPLTSCSITYDKVEVDGTALTISKTAPKSAFKSSGVFDTNDPINAWDGSAVDEVAVTGEHVANFTTLTDPKKISVTFTLSDMVWGEAAVDNTAVGDGSGYKNTAVFSNLDFSKMDALTLTKYMGNGINLGNTMEAFGRPALGTSAAVSSYETYWGQPITTAEMIQGMKDCGFDTIRIPVAWTNMIDYESGDYTINEAYLDRVEEIVNYALDAEMFTIINDHWDGGWWAMFGSKDPATVQNAYDLYNSMWTQIAERFADYGEMLIFENANEELGDGLNKNADWKDSGALSEDECYSVTNELNEMFVKLIRSTGGKNPERFLLLAGYNTDFERTLDDRFMLPKDTCAVNKLLLSVHYYTPWNYCGVETEARWGLKKEYEQMNSLFERLTKFTKQGYGVIIGEYAAIPVWNDGDPYLKENTIEFTANVLDNCDIYNYVPVLWSRNDCYIKQKLTMVDPSMTALYTSRCYAEEEKQGDAYLENAKKSLEESAANALENWPDVPVVTEGTPMAWIMWNGGAGTYSVGDIYNPADNTPGITAHDVEITGPGEYEVSLDFAGTNDGLTFAALALSYGETLYPGAILDIKEVTYDGEPVKLLGLPYTSSDDGICTRVNLLNEWVQTPPEDARNRQHFLSGATPQLLDKTQCVGIKNITVKFELIVPEAKEE